jgi:ATP-binding cassette subfamily B protein
VRHADEILVVAEGRIAEHGTHEELIAQNGKYAAMWRTEEQISFKFTATALFEAG